MGSLNKTDGGRRIEVSKVITIALPRSNPNVRDDINAVLDDGWHIATSIYDSSRDEIRIVFTRPKRQA
jgi:hypothetical protein